MLTSWSRLRRDGGRLVLPAVRARAPGRLYVCGAVGGWAAAAAPASARAGPSAGETGLDLGSGLGLDFLKLRSTKTAGPPRRFLERAARASSDCSLERWNRRIAWPGSSSTAATARGDPFFVDFFKDLMGRLSSPSWLRWMTGMEGRESESAGEFLVAGVLSWYTQPGSRETLRARLLSLPSTPIQQHRSVRVGHCLVCGSGRVLTKKVEGGVSAALALDRDDLGRERHGWRGRQLHVEGCGLTWIERVGARWLCALVRGSRLEGLWLGIELWMQTESESLVLAQ